MDEGLLQKRTQAVSRFMLNITAYSNDPDVVEKLQSLIANADLEKILIQTCPDFNEWMDSLPVEPVPGIAEACREWIRGWGNGGGDCRTEDQITEAIAESGTDLPKDLADIMYCSIAEYSKSPFEASRLVMDIMNESLANCGMAGEE